MKSTQPFPATLKRLLEIEGISERELTRRIVRHGFERTHPTMYRIYRGQITASREHMEAIASALGILPETFAEYRLAKAADQYSPEAVGWKQAIRNLTRLEQGEDAGVDEPLSAAEIDRRMETEDAPADQAESS